MPPPMMLNRSPASGASIKARAVRLLGWDSVRVGVSLAELRLDRHIFGKSFEPLPIGLYDGDGNMAGFPGFDDLTWFGFFAPAGTPDAVVTRLNAEINRALEQPDVRERLNQLGFDFRARSSAEFGAYLRQEIPKWAQAVKDSGAKAD